MCNFCEKSFYLDATTGTCSACEYDSSGIIAIYVAFVVFLVTGAITLHYKIQD